MRRTPPSFPCWSWLAPCFGALPLLLTVAGAEAATVGGVDYARDVQPILARHCYGCHGPEKQKAGLRLDDRAGALAGGDSGKVIIPGKSAESVLWHNVSGLDPDAVMPPEGEGDRLTSAELATLRAWIDGGVNWPDDQAKPAARKVNHWAFRAPQLPVPPRVRQRDWARSPIDAFVLARLEAEGIEPSPEADRGTLIRRLALDLTGLPPTAAETRAFLQDERPDAYERVVDRLLASPHFGERWGRHWLDLARYADSDGYEKDSPRPYAYLFRDWVIDAVNRDLPFDQFTLEQLAGDLLPGATERQRIATGFHRQTLTNREGGVDKEEFRTKATVDRVSTTGAVWLGLTVGCAECHSHKFDPISQREFYQLYSFFNNASEKDVPAPQPSEVAAYTSQLQPWEAKRAELEAALAARREQVGTAAVEAWARDVPVPKVRWTVVRPTRVTIAVGDGETTLTPARDGAISPRLRDTTRGRFVIEVTPKLKAITGFRIEALGEPGRKIGRGDGGDFALAEFAVALHVPGAEPRRLALRAAVADFAAPQGAAAHAIDGNPETGWSVGAQTDRPHVIAFALAEPLDFPEGGKLVFELDQTQTGVMNRFRLGVTTAASPLEASTLPEAIAAALRVPAEKRTGAQRDELARYFLEELDAEGRVRARALQLHLAKKPTAPATTAAILEAEARETHVHVRGDFLRKGDRVEPGTPSVLHAFRPRGATPDRLDLAQWLLDPANPLTARVTVNHVWKHLFGRALVTTVEDFGLRGEAPSHPELLDWLAVRFRGQPSAIGVQVGANGSDRPGLGWSRKGLIREIVLSAAYRQSSHVRRDLSARDPNNVLLARQNRFRLEAETVRDVHLAASGLLNPAIGGPSIRPQLPADIAALGYANSVKWQESTGGEQYRRGLYIFFQRTVPYPMLMTFDAPDSNTSCARRERSNTPLQALTLLNDPVFFEGAQQLGRQVAREPGSIEGKIREVFLRCLAREPSPAEMLRLQQHLEEQQRLQRQHRESAAKIAGATDAADVNLVAAWVTLCRVVMNLDEFLTRD